MKNKKGVFLMGLGVMFLVLSLGIVVYNIHEEKLARIKSQKVLALVNDQLDRVENVKDETRVSESEVDELPDFYSHPEMEMPAVQVEEERYIGVLTIPALGLELPVIEHWSYEALTKAPCCYSGSIYLDNMVIAAHNYRSHFGNLKNLYVGDKVVFTDMDGNVFNYCVDFIDKLNKTDVEKMKSGEWPLTLFTCTMDGQSRVTVRCTKDNE